MITQEIRSALAATADRVHRILWDRFISPDSIIYDYVGPNGEIDLPTAAECRECKPNALGWWSPIENAGFFNGIYLLSQCQRYERTGAETDREAVRRLVQGLYRIQDVCDQPGVIARGLAADGHSHYPVSSVDQCLPWLLGLHRYLATDIPDATEQADCRDRMLREIRAIQENDWTVPGERPGFEGGQLTRDTEDWIGGMAVPHLAIVTRILADLDPTAETLHEQWLTAPLANGQSRLDRLAGGIPEQPWNQGWIIATCQYGVHELWRREADPARRARFAAGLRAIGQSNAPLIAHYRDYTPGQERVFTTDWRVMFTAWEEQHCTADAVKVAIAQISLWNEACPAVHQDKTTLMAAIPAAWNVIMSEDPELIAATMPEILAAIDWFDYENTHYGALFYVENLVEDILIRSQV